MMPFIHKKNRFKFFSDWMGKCDDERKLLHHIACNYVDKKNTYTYKLNFYEHMTE